MEARLPDDVPGTTIVNKMSFVGTGGTFALYLDGTGVDAATVRWAMASGGGSGPASRWSVRLTQLPVDAVPPYLEALVADTAAIDGVTMKTVHLGAVTAREAVSTRSPTRFWFFALDDAVIMLSAEDDETAAVVAHAVR